ncbi:MAG: HD domain-containing protein [Rickettsiales bacterium]|nr:HD domain-containing protein [Rickettsiales bacterium]
MDFDLQILREFLTDEVVDIIEKNTFLEKFFTDILTTEKFRWDSQQTTSGKYSYLINHLIAVAKIAKIMNLPEEYIFAAFLHDVCEIPFGDVSVGLRNELAQKLEQLDYEKTIAKLIIKHLKELQDQEGVDIEIKQFLDSFNMDTIKDEKTKLIIKNILFGFLLEENPIIQFLEKLETNCLYLRENTTDFIKEVFTSSFLFNINYSLQFLPLILNSSEFDEKTKLDCIKLQVAFIAEFVSKHKDIFIVKQEDLEKFNKLKEIVIVIQNEGLKQGNFNTLLEILGYNPTKKEQIITEIIPYDECKTLFTKIQIMSDYSYNLGSLRCRLGSEIFTELQSGSFQVFNRRILEEGKRDETCDLQRVLYRHTSKQAAIKGLVRSHIRKLTI